MRQDGPLRFVVQDVYRRENKRLIAGRVESGALERGEFSRFGRFRPVRASSPCIVAARSRKRPRRVGGRTRTRCAGICRSRRGREPRDRCAATRPCCADHGRLAWRGPGAARRSAARSVGHARDSCDAPEDRERQSIPIRSSPRVRRAAQRRRGRGLACIARIDRRRYERCRVEYRPLRAGALGNDRRRRSHRCGRRSCP